MKIDRVSGFTPVLDVVVRDTDLVAAAVLGRVWRFTMMRDGVCRASAERIGSDLGVSGATVRRRLRLLCELGFLQKLSNGGRGHPAVYRVISGLFLQFDARAGVRLSANGRVDRESTKETKKKQGGGAGSTPARARAREVVELYERAGGEVTDLVSEQLSDLVEVCDDAGVDGAVWVSAAIRENSAAGANISVNYARAVIDRWLSDGFGSGLDWQGVQRRRVLESNNL